MEKSGLNTAAIKRAIPYGGIKEVAKRTNTSIYTVSKVINGGSENPVIIKALAEYVEELRQAKERLNSAVELLNQR